MLPGSWGPACCGCEGLVTVQDDTGGVNLGALQSPEIFTFLWQASFDLLLQSARELWRGMETM